MTIDTGTINNQMTITRSKIRIVISMVITFRVLMRKEAIPVLTGNDHGSIATGSSSFREGILIVTGIKVGVWI